MTQASSSAISLKAVRFSYKHERLILSIPFFEVKAGEQVFLHGPSGSGKTTFLGLLTGVLKADEGEVSILGKNLSRFSAAERDRFRAAHIGYIFQQFNLIPYLSVMENILLPCKLSGERRSPSSEQEAVELIERLGLKRHQSDNVMRLSVGQQQRVAVARALIGGPQLLVADEPTSSLDEERQKDFLDLLLERTRDRRMTVVFVSHNRQFASAFDRSVSLSELNEVQATEEGAA